VGRHLLGAVDEGADLRRHRRAAAARLGRRARHLDGLHQAGGLRLALQVFSIVWLLGCAGWAVQVSGGCEMAAASISKRKFDVVIVGAGGSGMQASLRWRAPA
jgi:hypothetical protein